MGLIEKIEAFADLGAAGNSFQGEIEMHLHRLVDRYENGRPPSVEVKGDTLGLKLTGDRARLFSGQARVQDAILRPGHPPHHTREQ